MSEKKTRNMSAKGWLHKTTTKAAASADGFIKAHREWLETGSLAELTSPILAKIDSRELMPTPGLEALKAVVLGYMIASETAKGEEAMRKRDEEPAITKPWTATIYDKDGQIATKINEQGKEVDLFEKFDQPQDAEGWTDRRLFDGQPDWFGVVQSTTMTNKHGEALSTTVLRVDALARMLRKKKGPVMDRPKSTSKLSWGAKVKNSVSKFSHG